jgi:hypothetical protein
MPRDRTTVLQRKPFALRHSHPGGVAKRLYRVDPGCVTMRYVDAILSYRSRLAVVCRAWIRFALLSEISSDRILCDNYFDRSNRSLATAFDCCPVLGSKGWLTTNRAVVWSCIDSSVRSRNRFGCVDWSVRWLSANSKAAAPRFLAKVGTMRLAVAGGASGRRLRWFLPLQNPQRSAGNRPMQTLNARSLQCTDHRFAMICSGRDDRELGQDDRVG